MLKIKLTNAQTNEIQQVVLAPETAVQGECLIGRVANCDLVLESVDVSRAHGKIQLQNEQYFYCDLGSANGSLVNHVAVKANQNHRLKVNDSIRIGDFLLLIEAIELPSKQSKNESLTVRCARITDETTDVKTFTFVAEPFALFNYQPGQFVTLELEINGEEVLRSYSISSSPTRPHSIEITVKRVPPPTDASQAPPGLVSNWLHDNLQVGNQLKISSPMGKFTCFPQPAPKLLMISAGSGITPMMSMSRWLADTISQSDIVFFHCARTAADIIFRQELELVSARLPNFHLAIATTRSQLGQPWFGFTGRLTAAMLQTIAPDFLDRTVYVCGPNSFVENVKTMFERLNFPMQNYYEESFGAPKKTKSTKPETPAKTASPDRITSLPKSAVQPIVHFVKSNQEAASDGSESILELAEQAGVKIRSNCKQGVCGACKKRKLEGTVRYESEPDGLDDEEKQAGFVLTCVAAPVDRVVIEA